MSAHVTCGATLLRRSGCTGEGHGAQFHSFESPQPCQVSETPCESDSGVLIHPCRDVMIQLEAVMYARNLQAGSSLEIPSRLTEQVQQVSIVKRPSLASPPRLTQRTMLASHAELPTTRTCHDSSSRIYCHHLSHLFLLRGSSLDRSGRSVHKKGNNNYFYRERTC